MNLSATNGSFQLSIRGYGIDPANWRDRNRLRCEVAVRWLKKQDSQPAPLQTWEIHRLIDNLQSLRDRLTSYVALTFAEPGLSFDVTALPDDSYQVHIQLDQSLKPAWHTYPDFPFELTLQLNRLQLQEAIRDLTRQLASYPER
ncbi:MAG: hypothetical protein H7Z72_01055 [Bacteroidetes bacterium]|nr:hypothetical protein [Fibrella sp.]